MNHLKPEDVLAIALHEKQVMDEIIMMADDTASYLPIDWNSDGFGRGDEYPDDVPEQEED